MTIEHLPNPPKDPPVCGDCGSQNIEIVIDADEEGNFALFECNDCGAYCEE